MAIFEIRFGRYASVTCKQKDQFNISQTTSWNTFHHGLSLAFFKRQKWLLDNCHHTLVHWLESELRASQNNHPVVWKDEKKTRRQNKTNVVPSTALFLPEENESLKQVVVQLSSNVILSGGKLLKKLWLGLAEAYKQPGSVFCF